MSMGKKVLQKNTSTKPSGIDWIGDIPSDWEVMPISSLFTLSKEKVREGELAPLSVGYMGVVPQLEEVAQNMSNGDRKYVQEGDIVINSRSDRMGAAGLSNYEGGVSLVYHVLRPRTVNEKRYFHYVFRNRVFSQEFYKYGNGIVADLWSTKDYGLKRISVPLPPKETQEKIVEFLDEKTEAADAVIAGKKRLIGLLKEKRSSIITHAVTKGLDPNAPTKPSGIDWIGDIPAEWNMKKLKFILKSIDKKGQSENRISLENIESWTGRYIETESEYQSGGVSFNESDILFGKLRPYLAKVLLAKNRGEALGDILVFRPGIEMAPEYAQLMLLSKNVIDYISGSTYGTKMPRVDPDFVRSLPMIYPSTNEQRDIAAFVHKKAQEIDDIIATIERQIGLLKEYRASLIYRCVTGKISV